MSKCVVWFEDTTKDPDRVGTRVPSLGLAVELLPLNLNVTGKLIIQALQNDKNQ